MENEYKATAILDIMANNNCSKEEAESVLEDVERRYDNLAPNAPINDCLIFVGDGNASLMQGIVQYLGLRKELLNES